MSNKEIDALDEFEKSREEISQNIVRRKATSGAGRVFGLLIIILTILGLAGGYLYLTYFKHREGEKPDSPIIPTAKKELSRTFKPQEEKPVTQTEQPVVAPPPPVTVTTASQQSAAQPLDENGLTPEQAAAQRRLKSGFGSADEQSNSGDTTADNGQQQNGSLNGKGDADNGLDGSLNTVQTATVKAFARKSLDLMLTRGNSIPCALSRAIDSTQPGQITCVTISPVMSSSGKVLLMETGTVFTGNYQSDLQQGKARIQATFDRLETPNHVFMYLRAPGIGQLGQGGIDGEIDTQFGKRFGNTILLATIQDTISNGASNLGKGGDSSVNLNSTTQAGNELATETLKNSINIPAILRKNQGEIINVDVLQDMDFSSVYRIDHVE